MATQSTSSRTASAAQKRPRAEPKKTVNEKKAKSDKPPTAAELTGDETDKGTQMAALRYRNPIPVFDDHVVFVADGHLYYQDGEELRGSWTTVMKDYTGEFDSDAKAQDIFEKCQRYRNRPDKSVPLSHDDQKRFDRYGQYNSWEEIRDSWTESRNRGIGLHRLIERWENGVVIRPAVIAKWPEFRQFLQFRSDWIQRHSLVPYRTELTMSRYGIGGQADALYMAPDGTIWLLDWKCKPDLFMPRNAPRCPAPLDAFLQNDETKFTTQVNGYANMLEAQTSLRVARMMVVLFHARLGAYVVHEIPRFKVLIEQLWEQKRLQHLDRLSKRARTKMIALRFDTDPAEARAIRAEAHKLLSQCVALDALGSTVDSADDDGDDEN